MADKELTPAMIVALKALYSNSIVPYSERTPNFGTFKALRTRGLVSGGTRYSDDLITDAGNRLVNEMFPDLAIELRKKKQTRDAWATYRQENFDRVEADLQAMWAAVEKPEMASYKSSELRLYFDDHTYSFDFFDFKIKQQKDGYALVTTNYRYVGICLRHEGDLELIREMFAAAKPFITYLNAEMKNFPR